MANNSDSDLVVVSYAHHGQLLLDGLWKFLNAKYRVENVPWGGGFLQAHQLILDIFLPPERIVGSITISDDHQSHLEAMLEFLYRGKFIIKREKLDGVLRLAKEIDFQVLVDAIMFASSGNQDEPNPVELLDTDVRSCSILLERILDGEKVVAGTEEVTELPNKASNLKITLKSSRKGIPKRKWVSSSESDGSLSFDDQSDSERILKTKRKGKRKLDSSSESDRLLSSDGQSVGKRILKSRRKVTLKLKRDSSSQSDEFASSETKQKRKFDSLSESDRLPSANGQSVGKRILKSKRKVTLKLKRDSSSESDGFASSDGQSDSKRVLKSRQKGVPKRKCNSPSEVLDDEDDNASADRSAGERVQAALPLGEDKGKPTTKKQKCLDCTFESNNALVIESHRAALHSGDKPHKCSQCSYATCWKRVLKRHVEIEHTSYPCSCKVCGQQCSTASEMDKHMLTHAEKKNPTEFKCPHCNEVFNKRKPLKSHVATAHATADLTCETCGRQFRSLGNLVEHRRTHSAEKRYLCPTCGKGFHQSHGLKDHVLRVHDKGPGLFVCDTCGKQTKTRYEMKSHQRTHSSDKPYKCTHCHKGFNHKSNMDMHVAREHRRDKSLKLQTFACDVCGKSFGTRGYLTIHKRTHTQERPYKCPHCDKRFNHSGGRKVHISREHSDKPAFKAFECDLCSKAFMTRGKLVEHRRSHTQERPYKCPYCGKGFNQSSHRNGHVARVHPPDSEINYACDECGKQLATLTGLIKHRMTHHSQDRPYKCPHCEMDFNHSSKMNYHISRVHAVGEAAASYVCEFCGKHFNYRNGLVAHRRTHSTLKTVKCSQCSFTTSTNRRLATHMDVVHQEGPGRFPCEACGKRFTSSADLKRHNLTHTKEKPFQCDQCPYACSQKSSLKQHVDVAHGEGRFRCETCGKALQCASLLDAHRRSHTQEKPFQCPHCDLRVGWKENLTRHIKVVHGNERHTCETCDKTLKSARQLAIHRRKHHNSVEKPKLATAPEDREPAVSEGYFHPMQGAPVAPLACGTSTERCSLIDEFGGHRLAHTSESAFDIFQSILRP